MRNMFVNNQKTILAKQIKSYKWLKTLFYLFYIEFIIGLTIFI